MRVGASCRGPPDEAYAEVAAPDFPSRRDGGGLLVRTPNCRTAQQEFDTSPISGLSPPPAPRRPLHASISAAASRAASAALFFTSAMLAVRLTPPVS